MSYQEEVTINCLEFEETLTDYLDKTLDAPTHKAAAAHALRCPLCHTLLNEVKEALHLCHELSAPKTSITHLEAKILSATMPEATMPCANFEEYLTDYLDGFLPAPIFHRWERHAILCDDCSDLPGAVVRSIGVLNIIKMEELAVPAGLHERILQATLGTIDAKAVKPAWTAQIKEWFENIHFPIAVPQFAPLAIMLLFAALIISQTAMANNSDGNFYQKGLELAGQTYQQSADAFLGGKEIEIKPESEKQEPIQGEYVNGK